MNYSHGANELALKDMNPTVLHCSFFPSSSFKKGTRLGQRFVYDYEVDYISEGDGDGYIVLNGTEHHLRQGDIVFRRPGSTVEGIMPYSSYTICFDPSGKTQVNDDEYWDIRYKKFLSNFSNEIFDRLPVVFHSFNEKLFSLFQSTYQEFINSGSISPLIQKSNMLCILYLLHIDIHSTFLSSSINSSAHYIRLKRIIEYISLNYDKTLLLNDLSKLAELSPNYFHAVFTHTIGKTLNEFITEIRINKSKELLLNTNLKISAIADKCGFDNASYFSSVFKKKCHISPSEFINTRKTTHLFHL